MTVAYFGPIALRILGDFDMAASGDPTSFGTPMKFNGVIDKSAAEQLRELVGNGDRCRTFGEHKGVIEPLWIQNRPELLGFYVFESVGISANHLQQLREWSSFTLEGLRLNRRIVITRTAAPRSEDAEDYVTPKSLVVQALYNDLNTSDAFEIDPGGTAFTREYDPRTDWLSTEFAGRDLWLHEGTVTATSDAIDDTVHPTTRQGGDPPGWIDKRGQDVRGYDFALDRTVWGPSHVFADPDDCGLDNGLIRCQVGPHGEEAHMSVEAFIDDEWRDLGDVYFAPVGSTSRTIQRARLVRVTPDVATVCIECRLQGPVYVTLKRGERMFRIQHGDVLGPTISSTRRVFWDVASTGGDVASGRFTAAATAEGLIRGAAILAPGFAQSGGNVGFTDDAESIEVAVFVATAGTKDAAADHHAQYGADCEQELRVR